MTNPGEQKTVQARILEYAREVGWTFVPRDEAELRRGLKESGLSSPLGSSNDAGWKTRAPLSLFFDDLLIAKVRELNPRYADAKGALLGSFKRIHTDIYGNREFVDYLRNRGKFFDHEEKRERDLSLIDYDDPERPPAARRNVYEVTEEWAFHNGHHGTREDVVFLINGIPVLVIECKNATKDEAIALGVDQIRRYHRETSELFVSQQLFTATDAIGFSYGVTWNTVRRNIFNWKQLQKMAPIGISPENIPPFVTPAGDVITSSSHLDAQGPGHRSNRNKKAAKCQDMRSDPYKCWRSSVPGFHLPNGSSNCRAPAARRLRSLTVWRRRKPWSIARRISSSDVVYRPVNFPCRRAVRPTWATAS